MKAMMMMTMTMMVMIGRAARSSEQQRDAREGVKCARLRMTMTMRQLNLIWGIIENSVLCSRASLE